MYSVATCFASLPPVDELVEVKLEHVTTLANQEGRQFLSSHPFSAPISKRL